MKPCNCNPKVISSVRISPVASGKNPLSTKSPAFQAAAALRILAAQFRLKKTQDVKNAGQA